MAVLYASCSNTTHKSGNGRFNVSSFGVMFKLCGSVRTILDIYVYSKRLCDV